MKGLFAFCKSPRLWRFGLEHTHDRGGTRWAWAVVGPVASNLGGFK